MQSDRLWWSLWQHRRSPCLPPPTHLCSQLQGAECASSASLLVTLSYSDILPLCDAWNALLFYMFLKASLCGCFLHQNLAGTAAVCIAVDARHVNKAKGSTRTNLAFLSSRESSGVSASVSHRMLNLPQRRQRLKEKGGKITGGELPPLLTPRGGSLICPLWGGSRVGWRVGVIEEKELLKLWLQRISLKGQTETNHYAFVTKHWQREWCIEEKSLNVWCDAWFNRHEMHSMVFTVQPHAYSTSLFQEAIIF